MLVGCHGRSQRATWLDPTKRRKPPKTVASSFPRCSILGNIVTYINGSDFMVHLIPVPFGASGLIWARGVKDRKNLEKTGPAIYWAYV